MKSRDMEISLRVNGSLIMKNFMGDKQKELTDRLRKIFQRVVIFKPKASYSDSSEIYIIGLHKI